MSVDAYEAWCRKHTAVHEAGHLIAARHFDCPVKEVWVRLNSTYASDRAAIPYLGWIVFTLADWKRATRESWLVINCAGAVAQEIWRGRNFAQIERRATEYLLELSDSDEEPFRRFRIRLGSPAGVSVLRKAYLLLRRQWPEVLRAARTLIVESRPNQSGTI